MGLGNSWDSSHNETSTYVIMHSTICNCSQACTKLWYQPSTWAQNDCWGLCSVSIAVMRFSCSIPTRLVNHSFAMPSSINCLPKSILDLPHWCALFKNVNNSLPTCILRMRKKSPSFRCPRWRGQNEGMHIDQLPSLLLSVLLLTARVTMLFYFVTCCSSTLLTRPPAVRS